MKFMYKAIPSSGKQTVTYELYCSADRVAVALDLYDDYYQQRALAWARRQKALYLKNLIAEEQGTTINYKELG